jgi:GT2 family glycosyltransferase/glycosyltransferase involved in cell wall biosynthesis
MLQTMSLQVFAFDDLLVLYWPREEKLSGPVEVLLDHAALPKPLLGAEFVEGPSYVLAAYVKGVKRKKDVTIQIVDQRKTVLAEANCQKLSILPTRLIHDWSPATRARVEKILLVKSQQEFPQLSSGVRAKIADTLAEVNIIACHCPDDSLYVRLPWLSTEEPYQIEVGIRPWSSSLADTETESVKALAENGYLHFFSRELARKWKKNETWLVDAGKLRYAPIKMKSLEALPEEWTADHWIEEVSETYGSDPNTLKAFLLLHLKPLLHSESRTKLQGVVEGIESGKVHGWAFNPDHERRPVRINISLDGRLLEETEASLPRSELPAKKFGNVGFIWSVPEQCLTGEPHEIKFCCAESGAELTGSPLRLGQGHYDGNLEFDSGGAIAGWIKERCVTAGRAKVFIVIDEDEPYEILTSSEMEPQEGGIRLNFREALPDSLFDTQEHWVALEILSLDVDRRVRLNKKLRLKANYRGHIDFVSPERIAGWIINTTAPGRSATLDLKINGDLIARHQADLYRQDVTEGVSGSRCGFEFSIPPMPSESGALSIELHLSGTRTSVLGPTIHYTPYDVAIRSLITAAEALNDRSSSTELAGGLRFEQDVTTWARTQVMEKVLSELRRAKTIPAQITLALGSFIRLPQHSVQDPIIDVIVPVYNGYNETLRCIASLLAAKNDLASELVVINDGSLDAGLGMELRRLAELHHFTLLENQHNLGFVSSVNRGMQLHSGRDVVLLNSDTLVTDGWLKRLHQAAYQAQNIGTVTPLSNNATICSVPESCRENLLPEAYSNAEMDALCAEVNAQQIVDLPTAVGFCMYIKRHVLDEIGYFDQGQWGKGYAEENDFCLRAANFGWRHVAACDVFVEHLGGVSFGDMKDALIQTNLGKLNGLYPDYAQTIQRFVAQDPLAEPRNRIIKQLLTRPAKGFMLFVIHGLGGGTKIAADELANRLGQEGISVLELMSLSAGKWKLTSYGSPYAMYYQSARDFENLLQDLRDLGVWHIHYHQTMHFPRRIWELPEQLSVPYDVTLHDYLPICPRINMMDESGYYCGDAQYSADTCVRCLKLNGFDVGDADELPMRKKYEEFGGHVAEWRAIYGHLLRQARTIFSPSQTTADIFRKHWSLPNLMVKAHPEPQREISPLALEDKEFGIAVIGAIGTHKGYDLLSQCIKNAEKDGLPLRFTVIGYTCDDQALRRFGNVTITGEYQPENLPRLIERHRCRIALFLSPWPETYSFTLSEACDHGLYPVALDIGAIAERLHKAHYGRLLPLGCKPKEINQILLEICQERILEAQRLSAGHGNGHILTDYYGLSKPLRLQSVD